MYYLFLLISAFLYCSTTSKIDKSLDTVKDFIPIKDDEIAKQFSPFILDSKEFGNPENLLYRASKDNEGKIHITYHYVWEKEENTTSGFSPFMSRNIYTGGLSLQKTMFGKKDIELVSFIIDKNKIIQVEYETAENYDPTKFGVKHKHVILTENISSPICFNVMSWNHLFASPILNCKEENILKLEPKYFAQNLWEEYTMVKEKESFFSRNRAHKNYEIEFIE